jgi:hypothetical protein
MPTSSNIIFYRIKIIIKEQDNDVYMFNQINT